MKIREIIRMVDITRVPRAPHFIEGVINLRGTVIPVINLRTKVRMPRLEYDKNTRIVIVEIGGTIIGFIVDAVREVLRIQENCLEAPPAITIEKADYITSVAKLEDQLVILMDTEKVLSNEEGKLLGDIAKNK
jgi:purine-binding chemotaxis protein CheW